MSYEEEDTCHIHTEMVCLSDKSERMMASYTYEEEDTCHVRRIHVIYTIQSG